MATYKFAKFSYLESAENSMLLWILFEIEKHLNFTLEDKINAIRLLFLIEDDLFRSESLLLHFKRKLIQKRRTEMQIEYLLRFQ